MRPLQVPLLFMICFLNLHVCVCVFNGGRAKMCVCNETDKLYMMQIYPLLKSLLLLEEKQKHYSMYHPISMYPLRCPIQNIRNRKYSCQSNRENNNTKFNDDILNIFFLMGNIQGLLLRIFGLFYNVLVDMSFSLLQVFHVEFGSLHRISNWAFYLNHRGKLFQFS